jgi:hypothetical protein
MKRFIEDANRSQMSFLPECLDDWVGEDNAVRVIAAFVGALDLPAMGFAGAIARLEREAGRNIDVMWLLGWLVPDQHPGTGPRASHE